MRISAVHAALVVLVAAILQAEEPATIEGRVQDHNGHPVADAFVQIWSASPRSGMGILCPSCYVEVGAIVATNQAGEFRFENGSSGMAYTVVVAKYGYRSIESDWIYPPKPAQFELNPRPLTLPANRQLKGRMVDENGAPIAGTEIEPFGIHQEDGSGSFGAAGGVWDPLVVSNEDGRFEVSLEKAGMAMDLRVRATKFAPRFIRKLPLNGEVHEIVLNRGSAVRGQLINPIANRQLGQQTIGLCPAGRTIDAMTGWGSVDQTTATDENGNFRFDNLPAGTDFLVYSLMNATEPGTMPMQSFQSLPAGEEKALGKIKLVPTCRLAGRVVVPDGHDLPDAMYMLVSRRRPWDSQQFALDQQGRFSIAGVPTEALDITINVPGYRLDTDRNNYQMTGSKTLTIPVEGDLEELEIFLCP